MQSVRVGCSGFPAAMGAYWRNFRIVEVQKTFYRPPLPATAERWRREAPADGEFAYLRLRGLGGYGYRYTDEDLSALRLKLPADKPCYVLFNNIHMGEDAGRFMALLGLPQT